MNAMKHQLFMLMFDNEKIKLEIFNWIFSFILKMFSSSQYKKKNPP